MTDNIITKNIHYLKNVYDKDIKFFYPSDFPTFTEWLKAIEAQYKESGIKLIIEF